jgi:hypothetical protein
MNEIFFIDRTLSIKYKLNIFQFFYNKTQIMKWKSKIVAIIAILLLNEFWVSLIFFITNYKIKS